MATKDDDFTLQNLIDSSLAGMRGYGRSATEGLLKYPIAAGITGVNRLTGGSGTFSDALDTLDEQEAEDLEKHPTASAVGEGLTYLSGIPGMVKGAAKGGGRKILKMVEKDNPLLPSKVTIPQSVATQEAKKLEDFKAAYGKPQQPAVANTRAAKDAKAEADSEVLRKWDLQEQAKEAASKPSLGEMKDKWWEYNTDRGQQSRAGMSKEEQEALAEKMAGYADEIKKTVPRREGKK